jgi:hypothetical protein
MNSASEVLPRRRALRLSAERFRWLAQWAVAWLVLIVATGATVRLTGSGLGCHHWPGCQPTEFLPARGFHSDVEFSNRVVASLTVLTTLLLAVGALRTPTAGGGVRKLAWLVFVGTLAQAPLGAVTVHYDLNPWLVLSHLLLSLVVLALGVLVLLEATRTVRGAGDALPALARAGGVVLLLAVSVLVVTGTFATAAGPHPGSTAVRRLWSFQPSVDVHARPPPSGSSSSCSRRGRGSTAPGTPGSCGAVPACSGSSACRWPSARRSTGTACPGGSSSSTSPSPPASSGGRSGSSPVSGGRSGRRGRRLRRCPS